MFSEFEVLAKQLTHHTPKSKVALQRCNAKLTDLAHSFSGTPVDLGDFRMHKECFSAIRSLQENSEIVVTKPDKGSGLVILDRVDYVAKMLTILDDRSKFTKIGLVEEGFDNTDKIEESFQRRFLRLLNQGKISQATYAAIRPTGSQRPKLYGLPKTHKQDIPLRPILSMIGSPQHGLAKWLCGALEPVLMKYSKYAVPDSFRFVEEIQSLPTSVSATFMASFDIKSLFTNVPLTETLKLVADELYDSDLESPPIERKIFEELLRKATRKVQFSFDGCMYEQVDGVAMGSPLGPILANIFVGFHERRLFQNINEPLVYFRYVDDTFALFASRDDAINFLQSLNNLHQSLKFTHEEEKEGCLPFLDVLVEHGAKSFLTSVYRKPTFTGDYVPWESFCPPRRKINLIECLATRAFKICSPSKLDSEVRTILDIFTKLGYPEPTIRRTIKNALENRAKIPVEGPKRCPIRIRLPYIGQVSCRFDK